MIINTGKDIIRLCDDKNITIAQLAAEHEAIKSETTANEVIQKMAGIYEHMIAPIEKYFANPEGSSQYHGKIVKDYSKKLNKYVRENKSLLGETASKAVANAMAVMEINISMGKIVASPTAGSCGVLPAAIVSCIETHNLNNDKAIDGLLTAGLVGMVIGKNATLSGAQGGCQAEIGAASAMAAAAVVSMLDGTPEMSLDAAGFTLKNMMGLVCDPVAGLVELPCVKRNGLGVLNALMCADMALSGIESVIPFDEVVVAMGKVGCAIPQSLRETAEGGTAATPTAKCIAKEIFE